MDLQAMKGLAAATLLRAGLLLAALVGAAHAQVDASLGSWGPVIDAPLIPVAVAHRADGRILMWSAWKADDFDRRRRFVVTGGGAGLTQHALFNPINNNFGADTVENTGHDMFCPGISLLHNGDIIVSGGQNADKSSLYDSSANGWVPAGDLSFSRGYASSVTLASGKALTLGGSWSGPIPAPKTCEVYSPDINQWVPKVGITEDFMLTNDPQGKYRSDNYGWFVAWKFDTVFHAGPSINMHWIFSGSVDGRTQPAGTRPGEDAHNGNYVLFDARLGKILTVGGSPAFAKPEFGSRADTTLITISDPGVMPEIKVVGSLNIARVYGNAIALPNGQIAMMGGSSVPKEFDDEGAILDVEIWDQGTEEWTVIDALPVVPRTYHSTSLLLKDGRIVHGGGGLCGSCSVNHLDIEIFSPPYLFAPNGSPADRPVISLSVASVSVFGSITITSSQPMSMVSMIRHSGVTHSTNTDQRRYELCGPNHFACSGFPTQLLPMANNDGIMIRGYWMVFAVNNEGVPSEGVSVLLTA